jgi:protoporphyrinogen oxidase
VNASRETLILGGGVTGLAAGMVSGLPVYEALSEPGGICSSYYIRPGESRRLQAPPEDREAYRFEIGGGHWIFGGDPTVLDFLESAVPHGQYRRISGVWLADEKVYVPYPIQNHLRCLSRETAATILQEMAAGPRGPVQTMEQWLAGCFGKTLAEKFFLPFHALYTAGLYKEIAPQDGYKSPVDLPRVIQGAMAEVPPAGYNVTFRYPMDGLDALVRRMTRCCTMRCGKRVAAIDAAARRVRFADGTAADYDRLICTLPLNQTLQAAGLGQQAALAPYTSVLVLNVGGRKGAQCPDDHWLYHPKTRSGFHRVGFYSNVAPTFLPWSSRETRDCVSIYVERAFAGGQKPSHTDIEAYGRAAIEELQQWGFLADAEVVDPTWIDVAYTWARPGSDWKQRSLAMLQEMGIHMVGRYARWEFQGIAASIRDGFCAGAALRAWP